MLADIILVALLLINALLGLKRGFLVMAGRLALLVLSLAITLLLLSPLAGLLAKMPALAPMATKVSEKIIAPLEATAANIGAAVESLHLPPYLEELMKSELPQAGTSVSQANPELKAVLFRFAVSIALFIVLFIIVALLIYIATHALTRVSDTVPVIGTVNRIGGLVVGLAIGLAEAAVLLLLVGFAAPYWPSLAEMVAESRIAGFFYSFNVLQYLLRL
jgi:uncharacterized membrane protein required for colicin V production